MGNPVEGIKTGDNDKYLRVWFEVLREREMLSEEADPNAKWRPMTKGGAYRRWYGNLDYIVMWGENGSLIKSAKGASLPNSNLFFTPALTWTYITSGQFSMRMVEDYVLHNNKGPGCYVSDDKKYYLLALSNTKIVGMILQVLAPTIDCKPGNIANIPVIIDQNSKTRIDDLSKNCRNISKEDWDSFETSWDFKRHPLV